MTQGEVRQGGTGEVRWDEVRLRKVGVLVSLYSIVYPRISTRMQT